MKKIFAAALVALAPFPALAFEAVDTLALPSAGRFPAYPGEGVGLTDWFVEAGAMHTNNVLFQNSHHQADNIYRWGAGIRHDARIFGRQSLHFEARADYYDFNKFSELDHTDYRVFAEWRWELGNNLSGTLGYGTRSFMGSLAEIQSATKRMVTTDSLIASGAYRFHPDWRVRALFDHTNTRQPAVTSTVPGVDTVVTGIDYVSPLGNALGLEYRYTHGSVIFTDFAGNLIANTTYKENEVALVGTYLTGTRLRSTVRLGHTHRDTDQLNVRDFDGNTGRVFLEWLATPRTVLDFTAWREARAIADIAANFVKSTGVAFGPRWAPSIKLNFGAALVRERRQYLGDALVSGLPQRDEVYRTLRLASDWEPARHTEIGVALDYGERDSNILTRSYRYNAVMINAKLKF